MTAPLPATRNVDTARAAARAGDWVRVRQQLEGWEGAAEHSEASTLLAEAFLRLGLPERARVWLQRVIPLLERRADRSALRRCVNMQGAASLELGDLEDAEGAYHRAVSLAQADGDDLTLARATNNLGIVANVRGQREKALSNYQLAIPAYQRLGNAVGIAECYHNMAITYRDVRDFRQADEYARRAIEFARAAANERLAALARLGRADIIYRCGDVELAGASARKVAVDFARLSDPIREADARRISGLSLIADGDLGGARSEIERAVELSRAHGGALVEGESLRALAELCLAEQNVNGAREAAVSALAVFQRLQAGDEIESLRRWMKGLPEESR